MAALQCRCSIAHDELTPACRNPSRYMARQSCLNTQSRVYDEDMFAVHLENELKLAAVCGGQLASAQLPPFGTRAHGLLQHETHCNMKHT